jgi:hypothetical protein
MKITRHSRFFAALVALFSILFMQLAVAAYACPGESPRGGHMSAQVTSDTGGMDMVGCAGMDKDQPSLCHAYDQKDSQSHEKPSTPPAAPFAPVLLLGSFIPLEPDYSSLADFAASPFLARLTAPPLSIRNCCFRI